MTVEGTLLVTEQCLLNPNRNPAMTQAEIEDALRAYTGATTVVWLGLGVVDDETDGHVDNLACFVRPGVVVLTVTDDRADPAVRAVGGRPGAGSRPRSTPVAARFEVHVLHQPGPLYVTAEEAAGVTPIPGTQPRRAGDRLAASYVNFYPANGVLVVPLLDPAPRRRGDRRPSARCTPDREVVGVPAREILLGGGNIHCITQPASGASARIG